MSEEAPWARAGDPTRLSERLLAEQDERRRLGELLHDGPVQHLAALAQLLDAAIHAAEDGDLEMTEKTTRRALELVREASGDLREIVLGIDPATLHDLGFAAATRALVHRVSTRRAIASTIDLEGAERLGASARIGLYQILREALDQAVRRGPPSRVTVSLRTTPDGAAVLSVGDDGARERRQAVIDGLRERAATMNARLDVERPPDGGTTVRVTLPPSAAQR